MGNLREWVATGIAAALGMLVGAPVWAASIGNIEVHSALGEPFNARLPISGGEYGADCVTAQLETVEGELLVHGKIAIRQVGVQSFLHITSQSSIREPLVQVRATLQCKTPLVRTYQVLLDLPAQAKQARKVGDPSVRGDSPAVADVLSLPVMALHPAVTAQGKPLVEAPPSVTPPRARADHADRLRKAPTSAAAPSRNVLRLSADAPQDTTWMVHLPVKLGVSRELSPELLHPLISDADAKSIHARFVTAIKEQDGAVLAPAISDRLQQELKALRTDSARWRELFNAEKTSEAARQQQLMLWIQILIGGLTLAMALAGYLAWRSAALQRKHRQRYWETLAADDRTTSIDSMPSYESYASAVADDQVPTPEPVEMPSSQTLPQHDELKISEEPAAPTEHMLPSLPASRLSALTERTQARNQARMAAALKKGQTAYVYTDFADMAEEPLIRHNKNPQLEVKEVSDLLEITEMWTTLKQPEKALEVLKPYHDVENPTTPVPWLALLQTYSAIDDRENYEVIAARAKALFNVRIPHWEQRQEWNQLKSLSDFPHIQQKIFDLWGSEDLVVYLNSLIVDDRDGGRTGFDVNVLKDLLRLLQVAQDPERLSNGLTLFDSDAYDILFAEPAQRLSLVAVPDELLEDLNTKV